MSSSSIRLAQPKVCAEGQTRNELRKAERRPIRRSRHVRTLVAERARRGVVPASRALRATTCPRFRRQPLPAAQLEQAAGLRIGAGNYVTMARAIGAGIAAESPARLVLLTMTSPGMCLALITLAKALADLVAEAKARGKFVGR